MNKLLTAVLTLLLAVLCSACTTTQEGKNETDVLSDYNVVMHDVNQAIDGYLVEPAADVYRLVTPEPARDGITNVLDNLNEPLTLIHCLLQGDPEAALDTLGRFVLNSTVGIAGIVQVTPTDGAVRETRDFGQTLGRWGVDSGPYLVLPLLGPSTLRDTGGFLGDWLALDPVRGMQRHNEWDDARMARGATAVISRRASISDREDARGKPFLRDYESMRDGYIGRRLVKIHGPKKAAESPASAK